jgi:Protein of unknown function (DUF3892)
MLKWADFCISEVQYDKDHKHIVKAKVRVDNSDTLGTATEQSRVTIVSAIESGKTYITITQNNEGKWSKGQPVKVVVINAKKYIKTVENNKECDNLENLPEF